MSITPIPELGQYPWREQYRQWALDTQAAAEANTIAADQVHADVADAVEAATTASAAAIAAAGLVDAPAGAAVLAAISEGGAAHEELTESFVGRGGNLGTYTHTPVLIESPIYLVDSLGRLFRLSGSNIFMSEDGGITYPRIPVDVPGSASGIVEVEGGRYFVAYTESGTGKLGVLTDINGSPTFTTVLSSTHTGSSMQLKWSGIGGNGKYVVSEYDGSGITARDPVQNVWFTEDAGDTWRVIYDHGTGVAGARHVHGAAYDKYRDAIWVTLGDHTTFNGGNRAIRVSWDRGVTWETVTQLHQPTGIMPLPERVIFGTDNAPNGILCIERPAPGECVVRLVKRLNLDNRLTHVAEQMTYNDGLILASFTAALPGRSGVILGSYDGLSWFVVDIDQRTYGSTYGYMRAFRVGEEIRAYSVANGVWHETIIPFKERITDVLSRVSEGLTTNRESYSRFPADPTEIPSATWTPLTIRNREGQDIFTNPQGGRDPSNLFEYVDNTTVRINRTALVTYTAQNNVTFWPGSDEISVGIELNGTRIESVRGYTMSNTRMIASGSLMKVLVWHQNTAGPMTTNGGLAISLHGVEEPVVGV